MIVDNIRYRKFGKQFMNLYIADENNNYIVEIEAIFLKEDKVELRNFIIRKKEFLGQGYGSFLLKETLIKLKSFNVKEVVLIACAMYKTRRLRQKDLINFYERNGFQKENLKMTKEFSDKHYDKSYYMRKKLWNQLLEKEVPMKLIF